jgi:DnaJ-class molecular chaperone
MRDPYEILGVTRKASEAEIKKAFRNLAKKHHPDTHANDPKAVKRFQEISAAYEIVGDKEKRAQFDRGEIDANGQPKGFDAGFRPGAGFEQGFRGRAGNGPGYGGPGYGGPGGQGPGGFDFHWSGGDNNTEGFRAEDILGDIFGGGLGGAKSRRGQSRKGGDLQFETAVTLEEAVRGGTRRVTVGDGRQLEVRVPPGVKEGQQIRLRGQGEPGARGGPAGDVLITITLAPHPYFTREGQDLRMDLPVTLKEAVLGAKVPAPTLSGPVTLTVPAHSNTGRTLRLKGKGLPGASADQAGDLYVRLVVSLPDTPDEKLDSFVKGWNADYDPRTKLR